MERPSASAPTTPQSGQGPCAHVSAAPPRPGSSPHHLERVTPSGHSTVGAVLFRMIVLGGDTVGLMSSLSPRAGTQHGYWCAPSADFLGRDTLGLMSSSLLSERWQPVLVFLWGTCWDLPGSSCLTGSASRPVGARMYLGKSLGNSLQESGVMGGLHHPTEHRGPVTPQRTLTLGHAWCLPASGPAAGGWVSRPSAL